MTQPRRVKPVLLSMLVCMVWNCGPGTPPEEQLLPLVPDEVNPAVASAGDTVLLVLNLVTSREVEVVIEAAVVSGFANASGQVRITLPSSLTDGVQEVIVRDPETKETLEQGFISIDNSK